MSIYQVVLGMVIGPVKWGPGGVLVFGTGNKNVFFLETTFPILINFGLGHQSNNASSCWDSLQHPPLPKGLRGKLTPTPAFSSKNLRIYRSECTELDTDGFWARLDWRTEINIATFGTRLHVIFFWTWRFLRLLEARKVHLSCESSFPNVPVWLEWNLYEASEECGLVRLCSPSGPRPLSLKQSPNVSFFSKIFVRNYWGKCAQLDLGAFGTCLDV